MSSFFSEWDCKFLEFTIPKESRVVFVGIGFNFTIGAEISAPFTNSRTLLLEEDLRNAHIQENDSQQVVAWDDLPKILGEVDHIVLVDVLGQAKDIQDALLQINSLCQSHTRIITLGNNWLWKGLHSIFDFFGWKNRQLDKNWLTQRQLDIVSTVSGFETIRSETLVFFPFDIPLFGRLLNFVAGWLPVIKDSGMRRYQVLRPAWKNPEFSSHDSLTIVIPTKNERGNIEDAIKRLPDFGVATEIIFVDGNSSDGTEKEIARVIEIYPDKDIQFLRQSGIGKGNAVREGFERAKGDILMILDADLTVPPEDLPKFFEAIKSNIGEFINGSRLVYPLEQDSMRFLNFLANHFFASIFTFLLNQPITDTLCGTKVLTRENYLKIAAGRKFFGDFDPFGDFDLIFGAAKLNLKIVDLPIHYRSRQYGVTQISRFRHGLLLLRMVLFASRKLRIL